MLVLAARLRAAGLRPSLFGYLSAVEGWQACVTRLASFIAHRADDEYIVVGHSLGSVLARAVLARLPRPPLACFFLAPPTTACRAARNFAPRGLYRLLTGEMGLLLADPEFMRGLDVPLVPTIIYAGSAGPRGALSPFGAEVNDGILSLDETRLCGAVHEIVPALHTFIMNRKAVADDIVARSRALSATRKR